MTFTFRKAVREQESLLIGLAGGTGSGKTMSAMRLAKGMTPPGQRFAVIDTESGRALHYAPDAGVAIPPPGKFDFDHGDLGEHRPHNYVEAIHAAEQAGFPVIVVDSMSHEWSDVLEWQEEEFKSMGYREGERMRSWIKPKVAHKKMVQELLQLRSHLILCFRAEMKVDMVKGEDGKTKVVAKTSPVGLDGWIPICDQRFPFELTASFLLLADNPGHPKPIKLEGDMRPYFPADQPIDEAAGQRLAEWARGVPAMASDRVLQAFRDKVAELGFSEQKVLDFARWSSLEGHTRDELTAQLAGIKATLATTEPRDDVRAAKQGSLS